MSRAAENLIQSKHLWWMTLITLCCIAGLASLFVNPVFIIAGIVLIVNVFLVLKYPMWGLLSYLIIFLLRPGEMVPALAVLRPELLTGLLVILAIVLHQKFNQGKVTLPKDRITLLMFAFLIVICLTVFVSYERSVTVETAMNFIKLIIFYYLIVSIIDTKEKLVAFIIVSLILIAYIALDAFKEYLAGEFVHTMGVDRMQGSTSAGGDPNSLANTLAATIPFVVAGAYYFKNFIARSLLIGLAVLMAVLITVTASRGGMVAFLGIIIGGIAFSKNKLALIITCVVLLLVGWTVLPEQYKERYMTMTEVKDIDQTSSGRWSIWVSGTHMIIQKPILGVGAGAFKWANDSGEFGPPQWMQAHNLYIQLFATTGIIGFIVWFAFIYNFGRKLIDLMRLVRDSAEYNWIRLFAISFIVTLIALLISGLFAHSLYRYTWYLMAALTAVMIRLASPLADQDNLPIDEKEDNNLEIGA